MLASQPCDPPPTVAEVARRNCSSQPLAPLPGSSARAVDAQTLIGYGYAIDAARPLPEDCGPHAQKCTPCTQRVTQADGETLTAAATQLQGSRQLQHGAGTAPRRRASSQAEPASPQLPRSHAEEALDELDAELLRMLAEADLIVASRSTMEAPEQLKTSANGTVVKPSKTLADTGNGIPDAAASAGGLSRAHLERFAAAPPLVHSEGTTAKPWLPAPASQGGDTQVQAGDMAGPGGTADVPLARAAECGDAAPGRGHNTAGRAAAAGPAACSTAAVAPGGSGVFAGCSDEDDDDVDWEAVIAAPPAGPCDAAPSAAHVGMRHRSGDPVAEPPGGPDALPACVPGAAAAAAAAHATRWAACSVIA